MTKNEKVGLFAITLQPYSWLIYICLGEDALDRLAELGAVIREDLQVGGCEGKSWLLETAEEAEFGLVYIRNKEDTYTIIHESIHAIHEMLHSRGVPINYENTEVVAYHTEWLVKQIHSHAALT